MVLEGVIPSQIPYNFGPIPDLTPKVAEARFKSSKVGQEWMKEQGWEPQYWDWKQKWSYVPFEVLQQLFSFDELVDLWQKSVVQSEVGEVIEKDHFFLWKVSNCLWHYGGSCCREYKTVAKFANRLKNLKLDIPDFEVRLTWTRAFNEQGSAAHCDRYLFLDAPFAALIYYKGKHVLTVSFAISDVGILVAQVQLREKKGNRFLYKLPGHYMDVALGMLQDAFQEPLWLVEGTSATAWVRRCYGKEKCTMTDEDEVRIQAFYNRSLQGYTRGAKTYERVLRTFIQLKQKAQEAGLHIRAA